MPQQFRAVFVVSICLATTFLSQASGQTLLERLEKRLEGVIGDPLPPPPEATPAAPIPEPGYLGIAADDVEGTKGALVVEVKPGTPAESAGLKVGDLITQIDGRGIEGVDEFGLVMSAKGDKDKVTFTISRGGKDESIVATLGKRDPLAAIPSDASPSTDPGSLPSPRTEPPLTSSSPASLGVTVMPVNDDARVRYSLAVRSGALITEVRAGSAADTAGFASGEVIVAAEGRRIDKPDDLISLIRSLKPGDPLMLSYYRGGTLYRKTVTLGAVPSESIARVSSPPAAGEDRPVLRRLERAIESFTPPAAAPRTPPADPLLESPTPSSPKPRDIPKTSDEFNTLRREVEDLRSQVLTLEKRLEELEATFKPAPVPRRSAVPAKPVEPEPTIDLGKPKE